ncbi:hypothetical protein OZX67_00800 [Bifidobacterium sp. ESL0728]|uniref:hypothetical protein n=1 Tax=Bifidobacterium sp. ESL0728 TaxID=2983220 RepID=UPI0023F8E9D3|nr:hypothetical protein [Bifidobacterium sp. ESL0728]WEV59146.1 hypothetical protein OZX67_00800 [Bifidobacterium sp. ESL0728]
MEWMNSANEMETSMKHESHTWRGTRPAASRHRAKQKTSLRTAATLLLAVLTMLLATACGRAPTTTTRKPSPQPKTQKVVYSTQYVHAYYRKNSQGAAKAAKDLKESGDFINAYPQEDGSVVGVTTERKLRNRIKDNNERIENCEKGFLKASPDYRYNVNEDGTAMTIWADKNLGPVADSDISFIAATAFGDNYYLKGHTGPWDMTITIRNCHTDQFIHQYQFFEGWKHGMDELGD